MYRVWCVCILVFAGFVVTLPAFAGGEADSLISDLRNQGYKTSKAAVKDLTSLESLNSWFTEKTFDLYKPLAIDESPDLLIPTGIYPIPKAVNLKQRWELSFDYVTHLKTVNIGVGFYRNISPEWFLTPYMNLGAGDDKVDHIDSSVKLNIGAGVSVGRYVGKGNKFSILAGGLYNWVDPRSTATGTGFSLYGGGKYFFTPDKQFSVNLNIGQQWWSGFNSVMPPNFYIRGGLSMYRSADMSPVVGDRIRPVELGVMGMRNVGVDLNIATANFKAMLPFSIRKELSVAPFAEYATELASVSGAQLKYGLAAGVELRLFGKQLDQWINPYIGAKHMWIDYNAGDDMGTGWSPYIGNRIKLFRNIALDANMGAGLSWENCPVEPGDLLVNAGIVVAFGSQKVDELELDGEILTKTVDPDEHIKMGPCQPLTKRMLKEYSGEIRTFARKKARTAQFGNLTDLKFTYCIINLKLEAGTGDLKTGVDDKHLRTELAESIKKIVIMFDKTKLDKLNDEIYLCYLDYSTDRYFGFWYDSEGALRPEFRKDMELGSMLTDTENPANQYMGDFDSFVQQLEWLSNYQLEQDRITKDDIINKVIEEYMTKNNMDLTDADLITELKSKYCYALVDLDETQQLVNKLKENVENPQNIGWSVLVTRDIKNDGIFKDGYFDPDDDFVFSNHEKISDYLSGSATDMDTVQADSMIGLWNSGKTKLILEDYQECHCTLDSTHQEQLLSVQSDLQNAEQILLKGFADKLDPTRECLEQFPGGNTEIANTRAERVKEFLVSELGIDAAKVVIYNNAVFDSVGEKYRKVEVAVK